MKHQLNQPNLIYGRSFNVREQYNLHNKYKNQNLKFQYDDELIKKAQTMRPYKNGFSSISKFKSADISIMRMSELEDSDDNNNHDIENSESLKSISIYPNSVEDRPKRKYRHDVDNSSERERRKIAKDTLLIVGQRSYVSKLGKDIDMDNDIAYCLRGTELIAAETTYLLSPQPRPAIKNIFVTNESEFQACFRLQTVNKLRKVCALNFGSSTQPDSGLIHGKDQIDCLARDSALYESLKQPRISKMFENNRTMFTDHLYSDTMIFSPYVPVFRDENGALLEETFAVSVITASPPNARKTSTSNRMIKSILIGRCRKIIQLAIQKRVDGLVLGPFGCGSYGNDPNVICKVFKKLLIDENLCAYFNKVVFAIKDKKFFTAFRLTF